MADDGERGDLGEPPEPDAIARAVRKSRVAKQLFEVDEPVKLGRYHLLERVGVGGTGVVWGAWDPELDRRVAIKLIKPTLAAARERIVQEGKALAKLAHPNVVAVHDVGEVGDQVYLVMEWVHGQTLRAYCSEPRSVREIVALYRAAGEGLLAAHTAGVIHRDFKPDNAIRGDDGRVRVLDFGLAGTPRYMAPEQAAGAPATAAADQYAFCVALAEALDDRIPGWLHAIIARGKSAAIADRFPSMAELLRALARDPATIWRRRALAAGALGFAATAFVAGNLRGAQLTPCDGDAELAWNPTTRAAAIAHLRSLGPYGAAEADQLAADLDGYGTRWAGARRNACLAHERHELGDLAYDRSLGCLARARASYETVIDVLATTTPARLDNTIVAARGLPAADRCALESAASIIPPPPAVLAAQADALANDIERARVLAATDDPRAADATSRVVARATALGYRPLVARAELAHGLALLGQQDAGAAVPVLDAAWLAAVDAFDDVTLVEAFARGLYAKSVVAKPVPATPGGDSRALAIVEHVAQRAGAAGAVSRALLYNNLGTVRLAAGDDPGAREMFDRSLGEIRDRDAELVATFANRALVTDDPDERRVLFERARDRLTRLLGANHRKTLDVRFQAAFFITDDAHAAAEFGELCTLYQRFHATVAADTIENCFFELGWLADARGDRDAARRAMAQVPDIKGPLHPMAQAYLLAYAGKPDEAIALARRVAEEFRAQSWTKFNAADAYRFVAEREVELGRRAAAIADARAALDLFDQLPHLSRFAHFQRRVARAKAITAGSP